MSWPKVQINDLGKIGSGTTPKRGTSGYYEGEIPWVKSGELNSDIITDTKEKITQLAMEKHSALKIIPKGSLLVAMYGATVGQVAFLDIEATSNQAVCHIIPNKEIVEPRYLFHFLKSLKQYWLSRRVGGGQPNISMKIVKETEISLPPLDDQRKIAAILDKVDDITNDVGNFTSREEYFTRSIFNHMFGDVMNNEKNWKQYSLGEHMNLINGRAYSKNELLGEGTPIIRIQNLNGGQRWYYSDLELPDSKYCDNGDLLFAWSATFGPFQWKGERSIYHYHIWKIELESTINKEFAFWLLDALTLSIKNQSHGASMLHYGKGKMEQLQIPVPPIQLQTQFSEIVSYIQSMKLTQKLDHIIELKKSTIQEMLT